MDKDTIKNNLIRHKQFTIDLYGEEVVDGVLNERSVLKNMEKNIQFIIDSLDKEEIVDGVLTDDEIFKYMEKNIQSLIDSLDEGEFDPKSLENKLLNSIERLESLEEKIGFRIENLSVKINNSYVNIFGDFFMDEFDEYYHISLNTTYYDKNNSILSTSSDTIYLDNFLGFESFQIADIFDNPSEIAKIRLYPKVSKR